MDLLLPLHCSYYCFLMSLGWKNLKWHRFGYLNYAYSKKQPCPWWNAAACLNNVRVWYNDFYKIWPLVCWWSRLKNLKKMFWHRWKGMMAVSVVWMRNEKFLHSECLLCLDAILWTTWKISVYLCMLINYSTDKMALGY